MALISILLSKNMLIWKITQKFRVVLRLNHEKLRILSKTGNSGFYVIHLVKNYPSNKCFVINLLQEK